MRGLPDRILRLPSVELLRSRFQYVMTSFIVRTKIASCVWFRRLACSCNVALAFWACNTRKVVKSIIRRQISGFAVSAGLPVAGGEST